MTSKLMPNPNVIFTYGTLRPGLGDRPEAQEFRATARHIGPARFQGKLYAIDWYPGVVDCSDPSSAVIGDIFEVGKNSDFFEKLDRYEGCSPEWQEPFEYVRTVRSVQHDGRMLPAWIYLFNWEITDQPLIESGNFADHVALNP